MKYLYNAYITAANPLGNKAKELPPVFHVGLFDSTTILETGVNAFLFRQIAENEWHMNNSVIVPNISDSLFIGNSTLELPVAAAVWQDDIKFWTYRNFVLSVNQIPLLVSSQDVMNYITGQPLIATK